MRETLLRAGAPPTSRVPTSWRRRPTWTAFVTTSSRFATTLRRRMAFRAFPPVGTGRSPYARGRPLPSRHRLPDRRAGVPQLRASGRAARLRRGVRRAVWRSALGPRDDVGLAGLGMLDEQA